MVDAIPPQPKKPVIVTTCAPIHPCINTTCLVPFDVLWATLTPFIGWLQIYTCSKDEEEISKRHLNTR
jgi:hypothetical protein